MEKEGRDKGENFVNRKRLNIVARSVAAILTAAAGAAAVEKTGSFDPLTNPANSANHLVLNDLHDSYNMLIDKLPEVDKAEATSCNSDDTIASSATAPNGNFLNVCGQSGSGILEWRLYNSSKTELSGGFFFTDDGSAAKAGLWVTPDSTFLLMFSAYGGLSQWSIYGPDGAWLTSVYLSLAGYSLLSVNDISDNKFRIRACNTITDSLYNTTFASNGNKLWWTEGETCSNPLPTPTSTSTPVPPTPPPGVGGIAHLPDVEALPQESAQSSDNNITPFEIGGAMAVAGALTAAGVLYTRRNRSAR